MILIHVKNTLHRSILKNDLRLKLHWQSALGYQLKQLLSDLNVVHTVIKSFSHERTSEASVIDSFDYPCSRLNK